MAVFGRWLASSELGQYLLAREQAFYAQAVQDAFGFRAVQLGLPGVDLLADNRIPWKGYAANYGDAGVHCDSHALPFDSNSLDLLLLPHALDFTEHPHQVLREAERVLLPEGRLVLTGFNPHSMWGACRWLHGRAGCPWSGNFLSQGRVEDWFELLGLEAEQTRFMAYSPPLERREWRQRWQFIEQFGEMCCAPLSGVYGLVAVKRRRGMRLIKPRWEAVKPAPSLLVSGSSDRESRPVHHQHEKPHD